MVKELLLGDNPFVGVSHLSQEKAREETRKATPENKARVIEAALDGGATGFTFSTHQDNLELLDYLHANNRNELKRMNYYILVPYAQSYVRRANVEGTPALMKSTLRNMFYKPSAILDLLGAMIFLSPERFLELFIRMELSPYLRILPKENVKAILLHEVLSELIIAFGLINVVKYLNEGLRGRLGVHFGLETRNFGHLHKYIAKTSYCPEYLMTPFNPLGYQMAPNRELVEDAVEDLGRRVKIIAISFLASGAVSLDKAIEYVAKYEDRIYAVTTASMNTNRIHNNFRELSRNLNLRASI
jgi:hypothetical protein